MNALLPGAVVAVLVGVAFGTLVRRMAGDPERFRHRLEIRYAKVAGGLIALFCFTAGWLFSIFALVLRGGGREYEILLIPMVAAIGGAGLWCFSVWVDLWLARRRSRRPS